jgi:hypothetical protein
MKKLIVLILLISLGCLTRKVETNNNQLKPKTTITKVGNSLKTKQIDTLFLYKPKHIPMATYQPVLVSNKQNNITKNNNLHNKDRNIKIETKQERQKRYNSTLLVFYSILATIISYIAFDYYRNK